MKKPSDSFSNAQPLGLAPGRDVRQPLAAGRRRAARVQHPEEARLALLAVALRASGPPPWPDRWPRTAPRAADRCASKRSALDEALHHPSVHGAEVDPVAEIEERAEAALGSRGREHGLDRALAHVLDRGQAEADVAVRLGVAAASASLPPGPR